MCHKTNHIFLLVSSIGLISSPLVQFFSALIWDIKKFKFDQEMAIARMAILAIFRHYCNYGHGNFQYKHGIDWYPLKVDSKTKLVVKRVAR